MAFNEWRGPCQRTPAWVAVKRTNRTLAVPRSMTPRLIRRSIIDYIGGEYRGA